MNRLKTIVMSLLLASALWADRTYTSGTYTGNHIWNPGEVISIIGDVTFGAGSSIVASSTAANPLIIEMSGNRYIEMNSGSSITISGDSANPVIMRGAGGANHAGLIVDNGATATITNMNILNGITAVHLESDAVVMEAVVIDSPASTGFFIGDCSPTILKSKVIAPTVVSVHLYSSSNSAFISPIFHACSFALGSAFTNHILIEATSLTTTQQLNLEGNYWAGGAPTIYTSVPSGTVNYDTYPVLKYDPLNSTAIILSGVAGANGTFNYDFAFYADENYGIQDGPITLASGVEAMIGINTNLSTYGGGTTIQMGAGSSLVAGNGSTITCRGLNTNRNSIPSTGGVGSGGWLQLDLQAGSTSRFDYTTIANATTGINLAATNFTHTDLIVDTCATGINITGASGLAELGNITVQNCNVAGINNDGYAGTIADMSLNANVVGILISNGNVTVEDNTIVGGQYGIRAQATSTIQRNSILGATILISSEGANTTVEQNNLDGGGSAVGFRTSGGVLPASLANNDFVNCATFIETAEAAATVLDAENNWFGASPPDKSLFSSTLGGNIDYEPWLNASFFGAGVATVEQPVAVNSSVITPADSSVLVSPPAQFLFYGTDNAFLGNNHLEYWLQVGTSAVSWTPVDTIVDERSQGSVNFNANFYADATQATYTVPGGVAFNPGTTYYWRVGTRDPYGWSTGTGGLVSDWVWSSVFSFSLSFPELDLSITPDNLTASAGDIINYTLSVSNGTGSAANNVVVNHVLPSDVVSDGNIYVGVFPVPVDINLYTDEAGTILVYNYANVPSNTTLTIPASIREDIVRYEVTIATLNNGQGGSISFGSYVR